MYKSKKLSKKFNKCVALLREIAMFLFTCIAAVVLVASAAYFAWYIFCGLVWGIGAVGIWLANWPGLIFDYEIAYEWPAILISAFIMCILGGSSD